MVPRATWEWLQRGAKDYMSLLEYNRDKLLQLAMVKKR